MARIKPFQAVRPASAYIDQIAALPYDVYNRKEAKDVVAKEPKSFLRIDRPETQFDDDFDMYSDLAYETARDLLKADIEQGFFVKEDKPCYYVYELTMNGRSQTGIAAVSSVDDYLNNVIKKHENTRADKEMDRIKHVDCTNAQTGPIFLAYRGNDVINQIVASAKDKPALYDFTKEDNVRHRVFVIDSPEDIKQIEEAFSGIDSIYIADGHHRCASAVKVSMKRREENNQASGEYDFFLSVLFPDEELMIMDYNRVVKDLNGNSKDEFLDKIKECFEIEPIDESTYNQLAGNDRDQAIKPSKKGDFSMFLDGKWYKLTIKSEYLSKDPVKGLDVSLLQDNLLYPILGIEDPKTDKRIDFVGGIRGMNELEKRVREDCQVAFAMYPTSILELFEVSDANKLMPPKSTWFEPKLRSGIFVHTLD